jgi:hypothetical protein
MGFAMARLQRMYRTRALRGSGDHDSFLLHGRNTCGRKGLTFVLKGCSFQIRSVEGWLNDGVCLEAVLVPDSCGAHSVEDCLWAAFLGYAASYRW